VIGKLVSGTDDQRPEKNDADKDPEMTALLSSFEPSNLYQVAMSDRLLGALRSPSYGNVFDYLLSQGSLPLALYRGVNSHAKIGIKANTMPYVYTNPSRDADVANCDMIFVLSSKPPDVTEKRLLAVTKQAGSK